MEVTIFTPTYNRERYLNRLYESLLEQTNKSFRWVIVDDGSVDKTKDLVNSFISEKNIDITYFRQENAGKHMAHNRGVEISTSELFFCVDSDDYLPEHCIDTILNQWKKRDKSKNIVGLVALRGYNDGQIMENEMPKDIDYSTLSDLYNIHGKKGETALVFKTEILKENLFPKFGNEKFLSEEVIYNEIDNIGKLMVLNKVIYIMEYLEDGLTSNYIKMWKSSPKGVIHLLNSRYNKARSIKGMKKYYRMLKSLVVLNGFCINMRIPLLKNSPNKILSIILFIPSMLVSKLKFK